jgi:hypothetical protein
MIELQVVSNEVVYETQVFPPLVEFLGEEFRRDCIREYCINFNLKMADLLLPRENERATYQLYFKKGMLGTNEVFSLSLGFDSITTRSENFPSLEKVVESHLKALDTVFTRRDFNSRSQVFTYQAHARAEKEEIIGYMRKLHSFVPEMPGDLKERGAIYSFDGPKPNSRLQVAIGDSIPYPGGIYFSIQFFFGENAGIYKELFKICEEFARNQVFPGFGLIFRESEQ